MNKNIYVHNNDFLMPNKIYIDSFPLVYVINISKISSINNTSGNGTQPKTPTDVASVTR